MSKENLYLIVFEEGVQKRLKGPYDDETVCKIVLLNTAKKHVRENDVDSNKNITLCLTDTHCNNVYVNNLTAGELEETKILE